MDAPRRTAVFVYASDPLSAAGAKAQLVSQPSIELVGPADINRARVALIISDSVDESLSRIVRSVRRDGIVNVVVVASRFDQAGVLATAAAGVAGFLRRADATSTRLTEVIRAVDEGGCQLPENLLKVVASAQQREDGNGDDGPGYPPSTSGAGGTLVGTRLSAREVDVLRLVAEGLDTTDIAVRLAYSGSGSGGRQGGSRRVGPAVAGVCLSRGCACHRGMARSASLDGAEGGPTRQMEQADWGSPRFTGSGLTAAGPRSVAGRPGLAFRCPVCGLALPRAGRCPNGWCRRSDREFSVVFAVAAHSADLRRAVCRYKYDGERWWRDVFAVMVARFLTDNACWFEDLDLITGVPSYIGPGSRRSWDPVGSVLDRLEGRLGPGWRVVPDLVSKRHETPQLRGRHESSRRSLAAGPLRHALQVTDPRAVSGSRLLVFDDVLAEGSTLNEVARALKRAGAVEVAGLVISRPARYSGSSVGRPAPEGPIF